MPISDLSYLAAFLGTLCSDKITVWWTVYVLDVSYKCVSKRWLQSHSNSLGWHPQEERCLLKWWTSAAHQGLPLYLKPIQLVQGQVAAGDMEITVLWGYPVLSPWALRYTTVCSKVESPRLWFHLWKWLWETNNKRCPLYSTQRQFSHWYE